MKGKTVILSVLIMSFVMAQIQVEAQRTRVCCPSLKALNIWYVCMWNGGIFCLKLSGCRSITGDCPAGWVDDNLKNSGVAVDQYCELGCVSSVCGAMNALQNSEASEIVNGGAEEKCVKACSTLCTKDSTTGVEAA